MTVGLNYVMGGNLTRVSAPSYLHHFLPAFVARMAQASQIDHLDLNHLSIVCFDVPMEASAIVNPCLQRLQVDLPLVHGMVAALEEDHLGFTEAGFLGATAKPWHIEKAL